MHPRVIFVFLFLLSGLSCGDAPAQNPPSARRPAPRPLAAAPPDPHHPMTLHLTIDGTAATATLDDTETARDFASLLPLTLTMRELLGQEKFARLPRAISEDGERTQTPQAGDLVYWPPGPDLAVFYRSQTRPTGHDVIIVGRFDAGVDLLRVPGSVRVTITLPDPTSP